MALAELTVSSGTSPAPSRNVARYAYPPLPQPRTFTRATFASASRCDCSDPCSSVPSTSSTSGDAPSSDASAGAVDGTNPVVAVNNPPYTSRSRFVYDAASAAPPTCRTVTSYTSSTGAVGQGTVTVCGASAKLDDVSYCTV